MKIKIRKATGQIEDFDPAKLMNSLIRSGAEKKNAEEIIKKVIPEIKPYTSTKKIYRLAHKYLKMFNRASVLRYSLKEALLRLGPSGYPFEKYIGKLLTNYGYTVKVGVIFQGKCVDHEVDVFAENSNEVIFVECKYRNSAEGSHDVKTAMYVRSRFEDLRLAFEKQYSGKAITGWLVTNTRFTEDAIRYAECTGLQIKSWRYPETDSLERFIEEKKLYPVTVLTSLNSAQIKKLIDRNIVLMKDLAQTKTDVITRLLSITDKKASAIKKQADELCFC